MLLLEAPSSCTSTSTTVSLLLWMGMEPKLAEGDWHPLGGAARHQTGGVTPYEDSEGMFGARPPRSGAQTKSSGARVVTRDGRRNSQPRRLGSLSAPRRSFS